MCSESEIIVMGNKSTVLRSITVFVSQALDNKKTKKKRGDRAVAFDISMSNDRSWHASFLNNFKCQEYSA